MLEKLAVIVTYNDWACKEACLTVVEDGHQLIIGRDLFNSIGLAVDQQAKSGKCVNNIISACKIRETIHSQFPPLVSRIGLSKTYVAKSKLQKFTAKHPKFRCVPINLQLRVTAELDHLQKEGHIEKLSSCSDEHFITPIVITVKKDQSIKIALDCKVLNKAIHNKYQMPNNEMLIDSISQHLTNTQNGQQAYFLTIDLKHAYSQL